MAHKEAYDNHVEELVKCLPMDDTLFVTTLSAHHLLPGDTKNKIGSLDTQASKASYFLNHVIKPALDIKETASFEKLLLIMEECDYCHVQRLSCRIKSKICKTKSDASGTSLIAATTNGKEMRDDYLDVNIDRLKDEDAIEAFTYLFCKLVFIFSKESFTKLKRVCMLRGAPIPQKFKQKIRAAQELDDIFDVLDDPLYCNWLNVRLLKRIAKNIENKQAEKLLQTYEDHIYSRKASEVERHFSACYDKDTVSKIKIKINKSHDNITVKEIIDCCNNLEDLMDVDTGTASVINSSSGCLEITIVIPLHCSLHAYKIVEKNILKLRQFHIQYLEIESFPKVFAFNCQIDEDSLTSLLVESLKFSNPHEVINYCYTYLENHMDADSVSHMMHCRHLISDDNYEAIIAAPNDIKLNTVLLQYVRAMDTHLFMRFCDVLKAIETQKIIGCYLSTYTLVMRSSSIDKGDQPMTASINENVLFLDLVDKLVAQMSTDDVTVLADKCATLMASAVHQIPLFTSEFVTKLINCTYPFVFKILLLPHMNWFDYSLLKQLVIFSNNKEALKMLDQFVDSLNYSKLVKSYHIPEFSQLSIPLDRSQYALLATVHIKSIDNMILQEVQSIKYSLINKLKITSYAIQLIAVQSKSRCFYWLIPNKLQPPIDDQLNRNQLKLYDEGIVFIKLLSVNLSNEIILQQHDFNSFCVSLDDPHEVTVMKQQGFVAHQELSNVQKQHQELVCQLEAIKCDKTQLSEEISDYQRILRLKQIKIEDQQKQLKSVVTKYLKMKQQMDSTKAMDSSEPKLRKADGDNLDEIAIAKRIMEQVKGSNVQDSLPVDDVANTAVANNGEEKFQENIKTSIKVTDENKSVAMIKTNDKYDVVKPTKEYATKEYPTKTEYEHVEMLQFEAVKDSHKFDPSKFPFTVSSNMGTMDLSFLLRPSEWSVLTGQFSSLCNTLPHNYQSTIDKLRNMVQIIKNDGEQLTKLIISCTDVRNINEKIITYLIIKSCYSGSDTSLVRLCDVMDKLIDPTGIPTCLQQFRHGLTPTAVTKSSSTVIDDYSLQRQQTILLVSQPSSLVSIARDTHTTTSPITTISVVECLTTSSSVVTSISGQYVSTITTAVATLPQPVAEDHTLLPTNLCINNGK